MDKKINTEFRPNYAIPPGETLLETLQAIGMTQAELADRTGRPKKTINEIIKGKAAITPETALQLERVLRVPASFWNNLERQYQEAKAQLEENETLTDQTDWLDNFPVASMIKLGWIRAFSSKVEQLKELLNFFGVATPRQWEEVWKDTPVDFRKSAAFKSDPGAVAAWLRKGELDAQNVVCQDFDANRFKIALQEIRELTRHGPDVFCPRMEALCADTGVVFLFIKELPKIRTSGATRWLTPSKALIQLTLRYKTDDHLWFTFFHEAGHILLHGKTAIFLEGIKAHDKKEKEANLFSTNWLIPKDALEEFVSLGEFSKAAIREFADAIGIAPGIVVGRLQHEDHLPMSHCNELKQRFKWTD